MRILGLQQATVLDNGDLRQDQAIRMGDGLVPENGRSPGDLTNDDINIRSFYAQRAIDGVNWSPKSS